MLFRSIKQLFLEQYPLEQGRELSWCCPLPTALRSSGSRRAARPQRPGATVISAACVASILKQASPWKLRKTHFVALRMGPESSCELPETWKTERFFIWHFKSKNSTVLILLRLKPVTFALLKHQLSGSFTQCDISKLTQKACPGQHQNSSQVLDRQEPTGLVFFNPSYPRATVGGSVKAPTSPLSKAEFPRGLPTLI